MHGQGYRDEITGLRALAVIIVCAYHFSLPGFDGGFVGVDVFFVISGYVISRLISGEVSRTGKFDFARFYLRRVRRLLPALIATVLVSLLAGAWLLSPQEFKATAESAFGALLSLSNVLFWRDAGYFDASAMTKPLLHTWSLSVEEQFYFVWPLVAVVSIRWAGRWVVVPVAIIGLLSFAANFAIDPKVVEWVGQYSSRLASYLGKGGPTIFFLTPFRVFEFTMGALCVWVTGKKASRSASDLGVALGIAVVGYCTFTYDEQMLFPSYNAILPCLGTCLVIHFGAESSFARLLLSNPVAVKLGELSYSIYLVHWPLVVYFEKIDLDLPAVVRVMTLCIATLLLAGALHEVVEKRFRQPRHQRETLLGRFGLASVLSVAAILVPAATVVADGGWSWRMPTEVREIVENEERAAKDTIASHNNDRPYDHKFASDGRRRLLIIGDSMADDFSLALRLGGWVDRVDLEVLNISHTCMAVRSERWTIPEYTFGSERAHACDGEVDAVMTSPLIQRADVVVLTHNWYSWVRADELEATFAELRRSTDKPVYVFGKRRWFEPKISAQILKRSSLRFADSDAYRFREPGEINVIVERAARAAGVEYLSWDDLVCVDEEKYCLATNEGDLLYRDEVHFTMAGARLFGHRMAVVPAFRTILE